MEKKVNKKYLIGGTITNEQGYDGVGAAQFRELIRSFEAGEVFVSGARQSTADHLLARYVPEEDRFGLAFDLGVAFRTGRKDTSVPDTSQDQRKGTSD